MLATRPICAARWNCCGPSTKARNIDFLPQTLQEAVAAFAADTLIEKTLGKELKNEFIKYKTAEWEEYHLSIGQWEAERYSQMF